MVAWLPSPSVDPRQPVGRAAMVVGTVAAVLGSFIFRFLTVEFTNDHFVHLSRGWQILQGDVPIRDFFDVGLFLQYYTSAATLLLSGHNLLGEALVTTAFIAAGSGFTFVAAARLSRSFWLAAAATSLAVISTPRLYGYPKVFFYSLAILGAWRYAQRPGTRRLIELAIITVIAFLYRHDHGVYIGIASVALLTMHHWGQVRQVLVPIVRYSAFNLVLLSPFLVFVQMTAGLGHYAIGLSPQLQRVSTPRINRLPIVIDSSAPLLTIASPADLRVNVRWMPTLDESTRQRLEHAHGLTKPEHVEDSTWSYVLADPSPERIGALINDSAVLDTHGINRGTGEVDIFEPLYLRVQRWTPIFRMQLAPGLFNAENALAWFYYVTFLLPLVCLAVLARLIWRNEIDRIEASGAGMAIVLSCIIVQTLVRGSPDSRLSDIANPISIIGAWVTAKCLWPAVPRRRLTQRALAAGISSIAVVTVWSVMNYGTFLYNLDVSRILTGPTGIWWRFGRVVERSGVRPIDTWASTDPGIPGLGRYVFECTAPSDRVFVAGFAPQLFFYAERPFAGGQVYLRADWHASVADQQLTVERLSHQRVPIIIERIDSEYVQFQIAKAYIDQYYRNVPLASEGMKTFRVLVDSRLNPTGTYEPLGLPCYR
jgi:hypothetical protein